MPPRRQPRRSPAQQSETASQSEQNRGTSPDASAPPTRESIQAELARFYVRGFILIIAGVLIVTLFLCFTINDIKDILLAISGVLSGPLGFIIGFYFKEELKKETK